jgi:hypothetical protein
MACPGELLLVLRDNVFGLGCACVQRRDGSKDLLRPIS